MNIAALLGIRRLVEDVLEFLVLQEPLDDLIDVESQGLILILSSAELGFQAADLFF